MKKLEWRKAYDERGNVLDRVIKCEEGYRIARFTVDGKDLYRPSLAGEFIGSPVEDPDEARAICDRHFTITGGKP